MTIDEMIAHYRQLVRDIDPTTILQTDEEIATGLESSRRQLFAKRLTVLGGFSIVDSPSASLTGTAEDESGFLVATHAAWQHLSNEYTHKLTTGQFGVVWRSGLEEENSLQASTKYRELLDQLKAEWESWVMIITRDIFASRIQ